MKLNEAYLCSDPDCDEVFSFKGNSQNIIPSSIIRPANLSIEHLQFCPICGNKNVLNIGRILNRKEEKNETVIDNDIDRGLVVPNDGCLGKSHSNQSEANDSKSTQDSGNPGGAGGSREKDSGSDQDIKQADGVFGIAAPVSDVFGVFFKAQRDLQQAISGADANTKKQSPSPPKGRCQYFNRCPYLKAKVCYNERGFEKCDLPIQGMVDDLS